jgi:hypothetical protein
MWASLLAGRLVRCAIGDHHECAAAVVFAPEADVLFGHTFWFERRVFFEPR